MAAKSGEKWTKGGILAMNAKKPRALKLAVLSGLFSLSFFFSEYRTHADSAAHSPEKPAGSQKPGQQPAGDMKMDQKMPGMKEQQESPPGPSVTLADLEQMALKNNPTLGQAEAQIRSAEGHRRQAGLYPNPIVGYRGEEFAFRHFSDKSEHFFFVEQSIVTAGKLSKSQQVFAQEAVQAQAEAEAQRLRVLNTVKLLYYEALGAQQLVDLRQQLVNIAGQAVNTSEELMNVGQADQPDLLETQNEASEANLRLLAALSDRDEVWQILAAVVGSPTLRPARLEGSLEQDLPVLDEGSGLAELLNASPEIKRAKAGVERAKAALARARAERIPDVFVRGAFGYSTEPFETLAGTVKGKTGPEASIEVGVRLPLFNRNQGNIGSAEAELTSAENELKRQELALRARLALAFSPYRDSLRTVQEYKQNIMPRAQKAYELYVAKYQEMAAAYPQVIISKRTLFQARVSYTDALVVLHQNAARIQGLLLTGGLDAPGGLPGQESGTTGEVPGMKATRDSRTESVR
jgi:cobalt-zinc-cadmium efflux system outer membrane protein